MLDAMLFGFGHDHQGFGGKNMPALLKTALVRAATMVVLSGGCGVFVEVKYRCSHRVSLLFALPSRVRVSQTSGKSGAAFLVNLQKKRRRSFDRRRFQKSDSGDQAVAAL
ncbi:MAG TPA: hypothetical protein VNW15_03550 [Rhizomicrobium sp.]|nr:hypothetical protein [Rhizomicrobium sp.]